MWWPRVGSTPQSLFFLNNSDALYSYDRNNLSDDDLDGAVVRIDGDYRTSWVDAGETATRKRWKRPRVTASADSNTTINIDVYLDSDSANIKRFMQFDVTAPNEISRGGTAVWGHAGQCRRQPVFSVRQVGCCRYRLQYPVQVFSVMTTLGVGLLTSWLSRSVVAAGEVMATASVTNTFVQDATTSAAEMNQNFTDVETFMNSSVMHLDGTNQMTGNLDLDNNFLTNVETPIASKRRGNKIIC